MFRSVLSGLLIACLALLAPGCASAQAPSATPNHAPEPSETAAEAEAADPSAAEVESGAPQGDANPAPTVPRAPGSSIGLDSLLRPRGELRIEPRDEVLDHRGGRKREVWYRDYQEALSEVDLLKEAVDATQERMRRASGGSVTYSPVGAAETHDPEVVKLRAQLKRDRQSLETARSRLREIEVEASLREVPDSWLQEAPPSGS